MTINNRIVQVPAVEGFRASPSSHYGTAAPAGAAGGPAGSDTMTFFCVMYPRNFANTAARMPFGRSNLSNAGWSFRWSSNNIGALTYGGPASVLTVGGLFAYEGENVPYLMLATLAAGTLSFWLNGVLVGTAAAGAFAAYAGPTTYGVRSSTAAGYTTSEALSDCGMLDGYDVSTFVSTMFGNGGPGLSARWLEDLRQGRYLTWPRAAVANSDWYWAGRDVVVGPGTLVSWVDRFSATTMLKFGQPQGSSFPARSI